MTETTETTLTFRSVGKRTKRVMHLAQGAVRLAHGDTTLMIEDGIISIGRTDGSSYMGNIPIRLTQLYDIAAVFDMGRRSARS